MHNKIQMLTLNFRIPKYLKNDLRITIKYKSIFALDKLINLFEKYTVETIMKN